MCLLVSSVYCVSHVHQSRIIPPERTNEPARISTLCTMSPNSMRIILSGGIESRFMISWLKVRLHSRLTASVGPPDVNSNRTFAQHLRGHIEISVDLITQFCKQAKQFSRFVGRKSICFFNIFPPLVADSSPNPDC